MNLFYVAAILFLMKQVDGVDFELEQQASFTDQKMMGNLEGTLNRGIHGEKEKYNVSGGQHSTS